MSHQYCTFLLDGHLFGVPVENVQEVLRSQRVTAVPLAPPEVRGLLNLRGQIVTTIDGQSIHAVHVRSPHADAIPLLLLHGWPGSFLEFEGLIGPLTDPVAHGGDASDAFDVVIPSHPGFGFSTPLVGRDWKRGDIAAAMLELMTRLG